MTEPGENTIEQKPVVETDAAFCARWFKEIALAETERKKWMDRAGHVYTLYEGGAPDKEGGNTQAFNILWSNTETLLPAVYNSTPQPDVRRRFRDSDKVGKAASEVLERALSYAIDTEYFFDTLEDGALDTLIVGRGLARVKYEPVFIDQTKLGPDGQPEPVLDDKGQPMQEKADERSLVEHVQWNRFLHGPGKRWPEVPWIGFEHRLTKAQIVRMCGQELADKVPLNFPDGMQSDKDELKMAFGTAEIVEVWDKESGEVFFLSTGYKDGPLFRASDPMELDGFWPVPKPCMAMKNTRRLRPGIPYDMYRRKAEQLERISQKIDGVVQVCKLRGIYDATMSEVADLLDAGNATMVPIANASRFYSMQGGIERALWFMPVDKISQVLAQLYTAEQNCKQTIYEITGISDVIRGSTDANETFGAQKLKAQFGGLRLKTLQREVKRFGRDLLRLLADVMCSKYSWQTFASITQLQYPTDEQQAQARAQMEQQQAQYQQQAAMAQQQGMEPPPPPEMDPELERMATSVTWEQIMQVLKNDRQRCYKVDVETDSTIAETLDSDMQDLQQVLTALTSFIAGALPLVQQGVMTMDGLKSVALQIVRRARLGSAVEDAVEAMQAPSPPQPCRTAA
jgi:hypothetical protein